MGDPAQNARMSIRRGMPGMVAVDKNASSGIPCSPALKKMLRNASANKGCIKVSIKDNTMIGKAVGSKNLVEGREWTDKFDGAAKFLDPDAASYLCFWREDHDCLLISFTPDTIKPRQKMLYASTRGALKAALFDLDSEIKVEEYNVTELSEMTYARYKKKGDVPLAYTDYELQKMEEDNAETAGGYGLIAQLMKKQKEEEGGNQTPFALPGLGAAAAAIAKGKKGGKLGIKAAVKDAEAAESKKSSQKKKVITKEDAMAKEEVDDEVEAEMKDLQKIAKEEEPKEEAKKEEPKEEAKEEPKEVVKEEEPKKEEPENEEPKKEEPKKEDPKEEEPKEEEPKEEEPKPTKEAEKPKKEEPKPAKETKKVEPKKEAKKVEPTKEAKKVEPKKEVKKVEPKKVEAKKDNKVVAPVASGKKTGKKENTLTKSIKSSFKYFKDKANKAKTKLDPKKASGGKKGLSESDLAKYPDNDGSNSLSELQAMVTKKDFGELDRAKLETYLSSREFMKTFGVEKDAFAGLPGWKKQRLKKDAKIF